MMPPTNRAAWLLHPSGPSPPRQAERRKIPFNQPPKEKHMSENTITVTLSKPIEHNGQTVTELTFRAPNTGDMVACDMFEGPMAKTVALMAGMAEVSVPLMKKLPMSDFERAAVAIAPLLPPAPAPAGSTSSQ